VKPHYRPDEEAETDWVEPEWWWYHGCRFCGREDHTTTGCPNRPGMSPRPVKITT
jgi:hypothetical protein